MEAKKIKLKKARKRARHHYDKRLIRGLCGRCGKLPLTTKTRCIKCLGEARDQRNKLKAEVIKAYGGKCKCCKINTFEFLTLEHSRNDGVQHKKEVGVFGSEYYKWLKKRNFPKDLGLEILCMNCNFSKGKYGYCPHEKV